MDFGRRTKIEGRDPYLAPAEIWAPLLRVSRRSAGYKIEGGWEHSRRSEAVSQVAADQSAANLVFANLKTIG